MWSKQTRVYSLASKYFSYNNNVFYLNYPELGTYKEVFNFASMETVTNATTVPSKSLETACHFPITFHYNTMSYQIKKNSYAFSNTSIN